MTRLLVERRDRVLLMTLNDPASRNALHPDMYRTGTEALAAAAEDTALAASYRLVAHFGWDDLIFTHLSARVPGPEHHFLINPYGRLFDEITASSLVKVDEDGNGVDPGEDTRVNPAGFTIHSAVHMARPEVGAVIHLHATPGIAVSAQKEGLLPISQTAMLVYNRIAWHEYEGVALDLSERERLIRDLGDKDVMNLRNHGTLTVGETVPAAFILSYRGLLRMLDAKDPSYKD